MVSIPTCHVGDWALIPHQGANWLPQDDKIILSLAPLLVNRLRLAYQLAKQFCVLVFPKFDFDRLGLISQSGV